MSTSITCLLYTSLLTRAGFTGISITTTHEAGGGLHSAIIQASKAAVA